VGDLGPLIKIAVIVIAALVQGLSWLAKQKAERAAQEPQPRLPPPRPMPPPAARAPAPVPPPRRPLPASPPTPARPRGLEPAVQRALDALGARGEALAITLDRQRSARRFLPAIAGWFPPALAAVRTNLLSAGSEASARTQLAVLGLVLDEVEAMAADRRDPVLGGALGDADALASACYSPVLVHARSEGLPLAAAEPATRWGDFQMSIFTGFIPTGVAPLFLPEDFFRRAAWWPAVAHEIGHSFLASVRGLDAGLRRELGLVDERSGQRPLQLGQDGLSLAQLERVQAGWFEETFCDVFGTLMCGPAYVRTMITLFAAEDDPREILAVATDGSLYDTHPPRQLRVIAGCQVLRRAGLHEEAAALRAEWDERHTFEGRAPDRILFPMGGSYLAVPLPPLEDLVVALVDRLVASPFKALGGLALEDVSGLDYGPHEHLEGVRARDALLAGRVPSVRDPRAVITGAVLAAHARPADEALILARARAAIPGVDTGEVVPDAYFRGSVQQAPTLSSSGGTAVGRRLAPAARRAPGRVTASEWRDAVALGAILERRHARPGLRRR
jgi:hypothetical protein